jgi:hypothetical protein
VVVLKAEAERAVHPDDDPMLPRRPKFGHTTISGGVRPPYRVLQAARLQRILQEGGPCR